jgi:hypothetical protein
MLALLDEWIVDEEFYVMREGVSMSDGGAERREAGICFIEPHRPRSLRSLTKGLSR